MGQMKFLALIIFVYSSSLGQATVDTSPSIFLPSKQKETVEAYQKAPILWWSFLVDESQPTALDSSCATLQHPKDSPFYYNPCLDMPVAADWLDELANHNQWLTSPPESVGELQKKLDQVLVQLSLPVSSHSLNVVRKHPLLALTDRLDILRTFFDSSGSKEESTLFAFLLRFPPQSEANRNWVQSLQTKSTGGPHWVGPHIAAEQNKQQIIRDLQWVATLGTFLILALILFLVLSRRPLFLLLLPLLSLGLLGAVATVLAVWGGIHGLTLAFGAGLVGIAMDYAFHGWNGPYDAKVWRTNTISAVTTLLSFTLLQFSTTPLIQQISLFAITGLSLTFLFCFTLVRWLPLSRQSPLTLPVARFGPRLTLGVLGVLGCLTVASLFSQRLDFSLQRMDMTQRDATPSGYRKSLESMKSSLGLYLARNQEDLIKVNQWAQQKGVRTLSALSLTPPTLPSRARWEKWSCENQEDLQSLSQTAPYQRLFSELFADLQCGQGIRVPATPITKGLFTVDQEPLILFKAKDPQQKLKIQQTYPKTFFLTQLTEDFPQQLHREATGFLLFCFLMCGLTLFWFFGKRSVLAFVPVAGAMVGILLVAALSQTPLSFVSFIALIILLGLTLDYGVFCTTFLQDQQQLEKTFGGMALSAATSMAGFAPLALCGHPVLSDLGTTIVSGLGSALFVTYLVFSEISWKNGPTDV
jgi:hypothetical protein